MIALDSLRQKAICLHFLLLWHDSITALVTNFGTSAHNFRFFIVELVRYAY